MAGNPNFPSDGQAERVDALVGADGVARLKLGVGSVAPTGANDPAAWHGVATHVDAAPFVASDGTVVGAGVDQNSGLVHRVPTDPVGASYAATYAEPPVGLAGTQTTGTLSVGTYYYRVSSITDAGESVPCTEASAAIAATHGVALTWTQAPGATGYRVYGRTTGAEQLMATIASGAILTWTDDGTVVTPTGAMPTTNTARISAPALAAAVAPVVQGALTNQGGTIATGAAAQTLMAANAARRYLFIQNLHATEELWFDFTATAVASEPSIRLGPWETYEMAAGFVSTEALSVIAATTAHPYAAKEG